MGKAKRSKERSTLAAIDYDTNGSSETLPEMGAPRTAADGRNVEGWSSADVSTYNELLLERAKLEKEKNELEYKAERRSTERALLNQNGANIDHFFAKQPGGDFRYIGKNACCLDLTYEVKCLGGSNPKAIRCKHEICLRSRKVGISWMEMDTIKYYELRIYTEKSERMKNALRKQREVELVRVKKVEEEEHAAKTRKMALLDKADRESLRKRSEASAKFAPGSAASEYQRDAVIEAAKQNDSELSQIRDELEDIRRQVDAGNVTSGDLRTKLDQAQGKMIEAERRNNLFRQMIVEVETVKTKVDLAVATHASLDEDLKKLCATAETAVAQAMTLMKEFFSASGPDQMEETMSRLKSTLEARGPMPKNMRESFKELENMVAESKAKGLKMDFKVDYGGAVTGNSMVDTMTALRVKMKESPTSQNNTEPQLKLDKELVQANQGCLRVEDAAEKAMKKETHRLSMQAPDVLLQSLAKIKDDAVAKSPIPPLSDIMLEAKVQGFMDIHSAGTLIRKVEEGASDREIAGRITSLVLAKAQNNPDRFLIAFKTVASSFDIAAYAKVPKQIRSQLQKVEKSMQAWVEKQALKKGKSGLMTNVSLQPNTASTASVQLGGAAEKRVKSDTASRPAAQLDGSAEASVEPDIIQTPVVQETPAVFDRLAQFTSDPKPLQKDWCTLPISAQQSLTDQLGTLVQGVLQKYPGQVRCIFSTLRKHIDGNPPILDEALALKFLQQTVHDGRPEEWPPLLSFVSDLYDAGYCAGSTCVQIACTFGTLARSDPKKLDINLRHLEGLVSKNGFATFEEMWFKSFSIAGAAIVRLHTNLTSQLEQVFTKKDDALMVTSDAVACALNMAILSPVADCYLNPVQIIRAIASPDGMEISEKLEQTLADLQKMVAESHSVCTVTGCPCTKPGRFQPEPDFESLAPPPLRILSTNSSQSKTTKPRLLIDNPIPDKQKDTSRATNVPKIATTFYNRKSYDAAVEELAITLSKQSDLELDENVEVPKYDIFSTHNLYTIAGMGEREAQKSLEYITLHLRAYNTANLEPPMQLLLTMQGLITYVYGPDAEDMERSGKGKNAFVVGGNYFYKCDQCREGLSHFHRKTKNSKFTKHLEQDEPEKDSQPKTGQQQQLLDTKKRFQEIIDGKTSPHYLSWMVNKLLNRAQSGNCQYPLEPFDQFESLFTTVGPIPANLNLTLSLAKAHLANTPLSGLGSYSTFLNPQLRDPVWEEISDMLEKAATMDEPFISEEEWNKRKLAFIPSTLLTDEELVDQVVDVTMSHLQQSPDFFDNYIDSMITAYESGGVPMGNHFSATVMQIKTLARKADFEPCKAYMKMLAQMMVGRWRIRSVQLPNIEYEEGWKELKKAKELAKATAAEKFAGNGDAANNKDDVAMEDEEDKVAFKPGTGGRGWRKQLNKFMNQEWVGANGEVYDDVIWEEDDRPLTAAEISASDKKMIRRNNITNELVKYLEASDAAEDTVLSAAPDTFEKFKIQRLADKLAEHRENVLVGARAIARANGWTESFRRLGLETEAVDEAPAETEVEAGHDKAEHDKA